MLFDREEKELVAIVQAAIDNIDSQVKAYEERLRKEKTDKIREFYEDNIHDIGEYLPFERVMRPEYANASVTMKAVKTEILAMIQRVDEGLAVLNEVDSPYAADMKAVFLKTYDIGAALAEQNRLEAAERKRQEYEAERARQKAEREAREKKETEQIIRAGQKAETSPTAAAEEPQPEEPVTAIDMRVYVTRAQMVQLKQFLKDNGIQFGPVPQQ